MSYTRPSFTNPYVNDPSKFETPPSTAYSVRRHRSSTTRSPYDAENKSNKLHNAHVFRKHASKRVPGELIIGASGEERVVVTRSIKQRVSSAKSSRPKTSTTNNILLDRPNFNQRPKTMQTLPFKPYNEKFIRPKTANFDSSILKRSSFKIKGNQQRPSSSAKSNDQSTLEIPTTTLKTINDRNALTRDKKETTYDKNTKVFFVDTESSNLGQTHFEQFQKKLNFKQTNQETRNSLFDQCRDTNYNTLSKVENKKLRRQLIEKENKESFKDFKKTEAAIDNSLPNRKGITNEHFKTLNLSSGNNTLRATSSNESFITERDILRILDVDTRNKTRHFSFDNFQQTSSLPNDVIVISSPPTRQNNEVVSE